MTLSVIIPAYNEEDNIVRVIEEVEKALTLDHELIVVNDHSVDATPALVEGLTGKYRLVRLVNNLGEKGFAEALKFGFTQANNELILPVMADLCDDLQTIKEMVKKMEEGYDVVCGSRYIKGGARIGGSRVKGFFSSFVGRSLCFLLGLPTQDIANAFKMYRKEVVDAIEIESEGFEISMEIPLKAYYLGFKIAEVPTVWRERTKGKSSFKMFKLLPNYLKFYLWAIIKSFAGPVKRKA